ncbi:MAG: NAD-dependent epimerase/dehydratase family protein [Candidatus Micrarchaeia archaeon]
MGLEETAGNILVTGASGRLGSALVKALIAKGYRVNALVQKGDNEVEGASTFFADINDKATIEKAFENVDIAVHLAAIVSQYKFGKVAIHRVNVEGTRNVVDLCKIHNVNRIIFASTVDVYGQNRQNVLNEGSTLKPADAYGKSKVEAERIIVSSGIAYTIFRMAVIYGPAFEASFFKVFDAVAKGKAYIIGDGVNVLSLINIKDVVNAYILAIQGGGAPSGIYNLGDGMYYTQSYLYNLAARLLGVNSMPKHISKLLAFIVARAKGFDIDELRFITSNRKLDISKVKKELSFTPKVDIINGGSELVNMFKGSPKNDQAI